MDLQKEIIDFIQSRGWSFFGIVNYELLKTNLEKHHEIFKKWTRKGYQGAMDYLVRMEQNRYDPKKKFPALKSVIVLAAEYDYEQIICSNGHGVVAGFAAGKDYHRVLKKKCIELTKFIKFKDKEAQTYVSVDSGPTPDRVLAEAAGLGFFGKNTCLIHPERGSFFLIASVMTNVNLVETRPKPEREARSVQGASDPPMPDCGSCRRCLDVCPTGALKGDGAMDARRCISYLTIENREGIPVELLPKIGNRLFGCDLCQAVCPFNRRGGLISPLDKGGAPALGGGDLGGGGVGRTLDLRELLLIETDEQFLEKFHGTPIMRAKRRGLLRNACVVAGNSGNKQLIPYLEQMADREQDVMLKEHAEWAIGKLGKIR
ncbi:tRNA epoxyqueuosine(34) reductase QueG [Candidatus Peregrinibacteria bacterium]|nr:tRNA epoxyqueuosine(34) reductase QueG [Candidatus Peregrinibacteria bacterium]